MLVLIVYGWISIPENKGESLAKTEDKMVAVENGHGNVVCEEDTSF